MELGTDNAYSELGLEPGASEHEVKAAWRRLVSRWHPDRNRSAAAISKMQRINQAIEQIRRSASFDDTERAAGAPREAHDGPSEAPEADFDTAGAPAQDRTINRKVRLTLEQAAAGCIKTLRGKWIDRCAPCGGAGYHVLDAACPECHGSGAVRQRAWYGWVGVATECAACSGDGVARQTCDACEGTGKLPAREYRINVRIPHGVRDGDLLHVGGRRQSPDQSAVHLNLRIQLLPHPLFELDADGTIHCEVPLDGFAWIANRSIQAPTLTGLQRLQLSRDQLSYRFIGQGFPSERRGPRADQVVTLQPIFPEQLGTDQEILLDQLIASSAGTGSRPMATRLADWRRTLQDWEQTRGR